MFAAAALAGNPIPITGQPSHPVTLSTAGQFEWAPPSLGGGGKAYIGVNLKWLTAEIYASEAWLTKDARLRGNISFGLRRYLYKGTYIRAAFSHNHEVPENVFLVSPVGSITGSVNGIRHRTGVLVGGGWAWILPWKPFQRRVGVTHDLSGTWFPDDQGPNWTGTFEWGLSVNVGPKWGWAKND